MKRKHIAFIIALVVIADQMLKFYTKTHFALNDHRNVFGNWFQLYFVENPGMAYGWKFGGNWGKLALTVFRLAAVIFGTWYLGNIIKLKYHKGFVICASLIYAGALGNLIDSAFYGLIFDKGMTVDLYSKDYVGYGGLAVLVKHGYASFLHGNVVDMLYFPVLKGNFPKWVPFWGGDDFEFFRPIFNLADAAISTGVITILVFQKRFFRQRNEAESNHTMETKALVNDESQVL
ncbi:MAG: lipoprotein signal peptidase [Ferruginibacter sp.]